MQPDDNGHFKAVTFQLKFYIICRQVYIVTNWLPGFAQAHPSDRPSRSPSLPHVRPPFPPLCPFPASLPASLQSAPPSFHPRITQLRPEYLCNLQDNCIPEILFKTSKS